MLKTTSLSELIAPKAFRADDNEITRGSSGRVNETVIDLSKFKNSKNNKSKILTRSLDIRIMGKPIFLIFDTNKTVKYLS